MAGESVRGGEQQQELLADRCGRLIPGFWSTEASLLVSDYQDGRGPFGSDVEEPTEAGLAVAHYFARGLAEHALADGGVDPASAQGQELTQLVGELTPLADRIAEQWAAQAAARGSE
ncbi:MAG TPA: hypothetical protein VGS08_00315 [Candidatus Saccharimonadales bacterium]|nr:hypothetical protein [Candidatus Saccharimonadales bacterium]